MKTYLITFADGLTTTVSAFDRDGAQETAIDHMEDAGIAHSAIRSIRVLA